MSGFKWLLESSWWSLWLLQRETEAEICYFWHDFVIFFVTVTVKIEVWLLPLAKYIHITMFPIMMCLVTFESSEFLVFQWYQKSCQERDHRSFEPTISEVNICRTLLLKYLIIRYSLDNIRLLYWFWKMLSNSITFTSLIWVNYLMLVLHVDSCLMDICGALEYFRIKTHR